MFEQFPPSSPVRSTTEKNPFFHSEGDYTEKGFKVTPLPPKKPELQSHDYPTPFPSSSTGRSSPVRHTRDITDSPPLHTSPPRIADSSLSGTNTSPSSATSTATALVPVYAPPKRRTLIKLSTDRPEPLTIGRKASCDVVLPSKLKISRKHALVNYLPKTKQIKLKCLGSNGLVVLLPKKLQCKLVKYNTENKGVIRDSEGAEYLLLKDNSATVPYFSEKLVIDVELTSFTLLQNESVIIPYVKGTVIDFRGAEGIIYVVKRRKTHSYIIKKPVLKETKQSTSDLTEFSSSSSESQQALSKVEPSSPISLHHFGNTKPFGIPKPKFATPSSSFKLSAFSPKAPRKDNSKANVFSLPESPIAHHDKSKSALSKKSINKRPIEQSENSAVLNKPKKAKKEQKKLSKEEVIEQLKVKGIDIENVKNVLVNHLAFANIQQTPLFQLQSVNSKTAELSRNELRVLLGDIKCVGIIYREGKDAAGKPLDEEYFYDLENDSDNDRRGLVMSLKGGRSNLRSCRKTHKQYFWKKPAK
ncbi:uncharacterized protein HLK63_B01001 [Nakaseomyces glabratus]|nr:target of SBF [Nakaseomyces glabratus]OXB45099.1 hypothetical protein B1J91_B01188g [Nakaseomyces glabratus]OXB50396.1 hypothetical protein B1J92_B01188g [Nakaseomyces glabratus]UCS18973.1 uncharacterized protein GW608_B01001 [Nakaseomyces glabratus]UCS24206.1 uncharacterized protein HLK63_B01001 [Nakaseomyces glabratus]